jgi:hypothetical protein
MMLVGENQRGRTTPRDWAIGWHPHLPSQAMVAAGSTSRPVAHGNFPSIIRRAPSTANDGF